MIDKAYKRGYVAGGIFIATAVSLESQMQYVLNIEGKFMGYISLLVLGALYCYILDKIFKPKS